MTERLGVGEKVITLHLPGIFRVVARDGEILTIESEKSGVRLTLHERALRRPREDTAGTGKR